MKYLIEMKFLLMISLMILLKNIDFIWCSVLYAASPLNAGVTLNFKDSHRLLKRMDLESCLAQFDIHKNTIIRTAESQAIGGKYLQGLELDTVEECQRLCCETDLCDVYVFEAKNDGYCYLFECGPPENFHCKFTRHANYTSAVLTPIRHATEITTPRPTLPHIGATNIISQQELELTNLKVKPEAIQMNNNPNNGQMSNNVIPQQQPQQPQQQPQQQNQQAQIKANHTAHCGRFQFMCHSGECIAVYNACDGIPQCADESDEGPECNGSPSSSAANAQKPNTGSEMKNMPQPSAPIMAYQAPIAQHFSPEQQLQNVQVQQQQPSAILTPPMINNREEPDSWANRKILTGNQPMDPLNQDDPNNRIFNHKGGLQVTSTSNNNQMSSYGNAYAHLNPMYNVALQQQQPNGIFIPPPVQNSQNSGLIYGGPNVDPPALMNQHQGNIIVPPNVNWQNQQNLPPPSVNQQTPPQYQQQLSQQQLPPMQTYVAHPNMISLQQQTQQQQQQMNQVQVQNQNEALLGQQQAIASSLPQQQNQPVIPNNSDGPSIPQAVDMKGNQNPLKNQNPPNTIASKSNENDGSDEDDEDDDTQEKSTKAPKKKQHKHKKQKSTLDSSMGSVSDNQNQQDQDGNPKQKESSAVQFTSGLSPAAIGPIHEKYKMVHENLGLEFRDHDGLSERPGGAVLSLTLGVLVTAALAILVGCRMRTVSRRSRRLGGKTPYSHEADFLVNGMYL